LQILKLYSLALATYQIQVSQSLPLKSEPKLLVHEILKFDR